MYRCCASEHSGREALQPHRLESTGHFRAGHLALNCSKLDSPRRTDVVCCDSVDNEPAELVDEIDKLRRRTALLGTIVGLLNALLRVSNVQLDYERLPNRDAKRILLRAIEQARKILPLSAALRITRLSASRDHGWCLAEAGCDDHPVARRNESVSSCSDRQLFPADLVVDTRGTARQRRNLSDPE